MRTVASFPMISKIEFENGCEEIVEAVDAASPPRSTGMSIELKAYQDWTYLKISKPFNVPNNISQQWTTGIEEPMEEEDEEARSSPILQQAHIEWDVIYSSSYQVPVIYFNIKDSSYRFPPTMETLRHIIPEQYRTEIEIHGPMGGVTITDHPITNTPVFFLHPCQTSDVLAASVQTRNRITPAEYLLLFMTSMGKYAQLELPLVLLESLHRKSPRQ